VISIHQVQGEGRQLGLMSAEHSGSVLPAMALFTAEEFIKNQCRGIRFTEMTV
jgi:hypothetical protein